MADINAYCKICNKGYHMCLSCKDEMRIKPWKIYTDTSEHYKIYKILCGFNTGLLTKEEAKERLQNVDLSDMKTFRKGVIETIKKIIPDENVKIENKETVIKENHIDKNNVNKRSTKNKSCKK